MTIRPPGRTGRLLAAVWLGVVGGMALLSAPAHAGAESAKELVLTGAAQETVLFGTVRSSFESRLTTQAGGTKIKLGHAGRNDYQPPEGVSFARVSANWDFRGDFTSVSISKLPEDVEGLFAYVADFAPGYSVVVIGRQCTYEEEVSAGDCTLDLKNVRLTFEGGRPERVLVVQAAYTLWDPTGTLGSLGVSASAFSEWKSIP